MQPLNSWLIASFAFSALVEIVAPLLLSVFLARRLGGRWRYWWLGFAVFLLFQVVTRVPVMLALQSLPQVRQALEGSLFFWSFLMMAAFTAGLFEEGGRWLALRFVVPPRERNWSNALMLGAGHGALESMLIGLVALAGMVSYLVVARAPLETLPLTAEQVQQVRDQFGTLQGWEPLLGAWERVCVLAIQLAFTVMVWLAFVRGARWWWCALAAHTFVDFTTVGLLQGLVRSEITSPEVAGILTEVYVGILAFAAIVFLLRARPSDPEAASPVESQSTPETELT